MSQKERNEVGTIVKDGEKATLVFVRKLGFSPETVWKALTEPSELSSWYMTNAHIDGRKGGSIDFISGPSRLHITGSILVWDPPKGFRARMESGRPPGAAFGRRCNSQMGTQARRR